MHRRARAGREGHVPSHHVPRSQDPERRQRAPLRQIEDAGAGGLHEAPRQGVVVVVDRGDDAVRALRHEGFEPAQPFERRRGRTFARRVFVQMDAHLRAAQCAEPALDPGIQSAVHEQDPCEVPARLRQDPRQADGLQQLQAKVHGAGGERDGAEPGPVEAPEHPHVANAEPRDDEMRDLHSAAADPEQAPGASMRP